MKKILFFGLFLCLGMTLKAQYGGEMTIGARLNYTGGGKLVTYDGKIVNLGYTIKGIVSPGYFVTNNIALGADLAYEYMMDDEGHQYTLETGGFFRLYAPRGGVRLYLQGTSGYGWGKSFLKKGHDGKHELWVSTLKPGLWARLKEYLALDISLMSLEYIINNCDSICCKTCDHQGCTCTQIRCTYSRTCKLLHTINNC